MKPILDWGDPDYRDPIQRAEDDEAATGRVRCIGCGKFVPRSANWNQCPDCDVREPEE